MLKQSLNILKNLFLNRYIYRHIDRLSSIPESPERAPFSLTESGAWRDIFGSNDIDSIYK